MWALRALMRAWYMYIIIITIVLCDALRNDHTDFRHTNTVWLIDWLIDRVTEWNNGRVWPRCVWLLYQLHTCPVETVPAVVEPELWSLLYKDVH